MLNRIVDFSLRQRWVSLAATLVIAALGVYNYQRLPIDAVPDITNVQVQINTEAPGYSPLEAEQRVTFSVENALAGLPSLEYTRSSLAYGLSQITAVFEDGTDLYFARQLVGERLNEVRAQLPPDLDPTLGPIATGLGEIFMYTVTADPGRVHTPDRSAHGPGLDRSSAIAPDARRRRGEHDWRLSKSHHHCTEPAATCRLRPDVSTI